MLTSTARVAMVLPAPATAARYVKLFAAGADGTVGRFTLLANSHGRVTLSATSVCDAGVRAKATPTRTRSGPVRH